MSSKSGGYAIAAVEFLAAAVLLFIPGAQGIAVSLAVASAATFAGTALTPTPPRQRTLKDSPTYGLKNFENPRGPEALVPILYGTHRLKPVVLAESVREAVEGVSPGDVRNTAEQEFRWLGAVAEGLVSDISEIRINDRDALSRRREEELGRGNGTKKEFTFPHRWVHLGEDEAPDVELYVDGVLKSWAKQTASVEFTMPTAASEKSFTIKRDDKDDRIIGSTLRVYVRGPGRPETEQLRRAGTYLWSAQKLAPWKMRLRFKTRPPAGYTVRVTYDVLHSDSLAIRQASDGTTKALFGTAPANGKKVTAKYRTTNFHGLRISWRPGSLDQQPMDGFTDQEQTRNPTTTKLTKSAAPLPYDTSGREVDDLRVGIVATQGMIQYKTDGGTEAVTARIRVDYRKVGATAWVTLRSSSGDSFKLIGQRSSEMRWEIDIRDELERRVAEGDSGAADALADFERAAYQVQVSRLTLESSDPLVADELHFQYVTEVIRDGLSHPGTALLGLRGRVGAAIGASGVLQVSCLATRAPLYDPRSAGGSRDIGSSQNPALAIRDLLTSSEGTAVERFGGGSFFTGSDLQLGAGAALNGFEAFADFCDAWVLRPGDDATQAASATNGERRCRLNVVLDTPASLMETVADLAFLGYCFATLQGAKWRFPLDQEGEAVFTFVDDIDPPNQNMSGFALRIDEWRNSPTGVKGTFWNEAIEYDRDELLHPVENLPESTPLNIREVDLRGVTRESEAGRMLRHLAEQARETPFPCSWDAHPGVQHVEAGDIVTVRTRVPYSTGANALELKVRVLAAVVGRDEQGKVTTRYEGRVMASQSYALNPVSVPVSSVPATTASRARAGSSASRGAARRVTGVRVRVQAVRR
jgi:hypothetical protein